MNLTSLANRYKSDKGTVYGNPPHRYTYLYDLIFHPFKHLSFNFLEMGLAVGGPEVGGPVDRIVESPSINMWLEYFPDATVYGFDISDFSHMQYQRFHFIRGDSGSTEDIKRLADTASGFGIIIDDASHASYHQQLAFRFLWPKLSPGGLYVIEDLQWQSPAFEETLPAVPKTAALFANFFEKNVYVQGVVLEQEFMRSIEAELHSFAIFPSMDGSASAMKQIILRKR